MKRIALSIFALLCTGCANNVQYLGKIENIKFYSVRSSSFDGPDLAALVTDDGGKVKIENTFSGAGIGTAIGSTLVTSGTSLGSAVLAAEKADLTTTVKVAK